MHELKTTSLTDFVRNAEIIWLKGVDSIPMEARTSGLFRVENIPDHTGNTREYSEIDLEEYAKRKAEGQSASRAQMQQGYTKIATLQRIGHDETITWEMRHWNKYPEVVARLTNMGQTVAKRMELDMQHRFTFMTATSYTNMDGETVSTTVGDTLALASTAHTLRATSTTYRNRLANNPVFSRGAMEAMEKQIVENTLNHFGQKKTLNFDILWHTGDPATENTMRELMRSTAAPDQNNSGVVNVNASKYKIVKLSRVATDKNGNVDSTKAKYWGIASSAITSAYLGINEEPHMLIPPEAGNNAEDRINNEDWFFGGRGAYFVCVVSANWVHVSTGDGTA